MLRLAIVLTAALLPPLLAHAQAEAAPRSLAAVADAALADAAKRSGLPAAQLKVAFAASVTWSDGSLGCPAPGLLYTQALVAGYRVRVKVGAEVWDYHAGERGGLVLCPAGRAREPGPNSRN
ncbi:MAG: putative domain containing protein [Ramlibacter sp.]|nr:putative domain containing protein [Ramlibacter sp.]